MNGVLLFHLSVVFLAQHILAETKILDSYCHGSILKGVPNEAFIASTHLLDHAPSRVRMDDSIDVWKASLSDNNQYIQIDLGRHSLVRGVVTRGCNSAYFCNEFVTSYRIQYSLNDVSWRTVQTESRVDKIFKGNTDGHALVATEIGCDVIARYIRLLPVAWNDHITMKIDILGCALSKGSHNARSNLVQLHHSDTSSENLIHPEGSKPVNAFTIATTKKSSTAKGCLGGQYMTSCLLIPDGYYSHCLSGQKFIQCNNNVFTEHVCQYEHAWDDNVKSCVYNVQMSTE